MSNGDKKIRLLAAHDHPLTRKGFEHRFSYLTDLELCAVLSNGKELLDAVETYQPAIVIMDLKMPKLDARDVAYKIQTTFPQVGMIAYTMHENEGLVIQLRKAGVRGYLLKSVKPSGLSTQAVNTIVLP